MNEHNAADHLRDRLAAADPARGAPIDPIPNHLMEQIMNTTLTTPTPSDSSPDRAPERARRGWRLPAALSGVATAAVAAIVGVVALGGGTSPVTADPLELTSGSDALASCMAFSTDILTGIPTAFEGTVISVDGPTVTLDVDQWYADGTDSAAESVVINAPEGMEALIGGIAFEPGGQYLVSADAEGNVAYCGYTAAATDDLRAAFDEAFPG